MSTEAAALGVPKSLAIQRRLSRYLLGGRIHPAILLTGFDVATKFEVAKGMAKALLCKNKKAAAFCGSCATCSRIDRDIHPDVFLFREIEEDNIKIETVREISAQMNIPSLEGQRKVCLLDECHRMNPAASNAFLKTLEEPGEGRFFLLLSSQPGRLLPTLLSRVIQFHFKPDQELLPSLEEDDQFQSLLRGLSQSGNLSSLAVAVEEKGKALRFLQFMERELREETLSGKSRVSFLSRIRPDNADLLFAEVLETEGRLRSNASSGLMIENLFRQHFL